MSLPQPDLGVLRKAQRGDERAFAIIVRTYEQPVYNYIVRLTGDRNLAEDLTLEEGGYRNPPCPLLSAPTRPGRSRRVVYQFGRSDRILS